MDLLCKEYTGCFSGPTYDFPEDKFNYFFFQVRNILILSFLQCVCFNVDNIHEFIWSRNFKKYFYFIFCNVFTILFTKLFVFISAICTRSIYLIMMHAWDTLKKLFHMFFQQPNKMWEIWTVCHSNEETFKTVSRKKQSKHSKDEKFLEICL